jgi:integrase
MPEETSEGPRLRSSLSVIDADPASLDPLGFDVVVASALDGICGADLRPLTARRPPAGGPMAIDRGSPSRASGGASSTTSSGPGRDAAIDRLFLSVRRDRRIGEYEPLTNLGIQQLVRNLAELAGVHKRVYRHLLRHSYATWALNHGMNPIMLAQVLGHSSLVMIQRNYAHSTPADAHELMARLLAAD